MVQINSLAYRKLADSILPQVVYLMNSLNNRLISLENETYDKRHYKTYKFKNGKCTIQHHELKYSKDDFKQALIDDGYLPVVDYVINSLKTYLIKNWDEDLEKEQEPIQLDTVLKVLSVLPDDSVPSFPTFDDIDVYKCLRALTFALSLGYANYEKYNIVFAYLSEVSLNIINSMLYD